METKKEINDLINELRERFPDLSVSAIDEAEPPLPPVEESQQAAPSEDELPAEIKALLQQAAKEIASRIFVEDDDLLPGMVKLSPIDDSPEAREAMQAVRGSALRQGGFMRLQGRCYHYILDHKGNPVPCEDKATLKRFQRKKRDVIKVKTLKYDGLTMKIVTTFVIHNPMFGDEPPPPRWMTSVVCVNTGQIGFQCATTNRSNVLAMHRDTVAKTKHAIATEHRVRRPSPRRRRVALRRIAEGIGALGKRGRHG